jgi:glycosyltransferase involved in cell wall biosynthesis
MSDSPDPGSISVVIPTYNDIAHVGDALSSIVGQTALPGEIVVCDDGSEDDTERLVREFADQHADKLAVRYTKIPHSGLAAARNEGIAFARGDWIAKCDSDDMWLPTKLERQIAFLSEWRGSEPVAILGTYGYNVNDAKRVISEARMGPTSEADFQELRRRGAVFFILQSSILFPRTGFQAVGGYSDEYGPADTALFFSRMAERGIVITMPEPLIYYRKRAGSVQLDRFWEKRDALDRLAVNGRRRAAGEPPLDQREFAALLASASARKRFTRRRKTWGMYYYRSGAAHIVNGHRVRGIAELLLASIMDGARLRSGVMNRLQLSSLRTAGTAQSRADATSGELSR